jgi:hypothetical protein
MRLDLSSVPGQRQRRTVQRATSAALGIEVKLAGALIRLRRRARAILMFDVNDGAKGKYRRVEVGWRRLCPLRPQSAPCRPRRPHTALSVVRPFYHITPFGVDRSARM